MNASIYFFTDLHFSESYEINPAQISSIGNIINDDKNNFIFLVFSGDLVNSGKAKEYEIFNDFLISIKKIISEEKNVETIFCPGNHDIQYKNNEEYTLTSLINDTKARDISKPLRRRLSRMASFESYRDKNMSKFEKISDLIVKSTFMIDEQKIIFYALNDVAFSCYGNENHSSDSKGNIPFSKKDSSLILRESPTDIVVTVMHFPYDYFTDDDSDAFRNVICDNSNVVLFGHKHHNEQTVFIDKNKITCLMGSVFYDYKNPNFSSFIRIDLNEKRYQIFSFDNDYYGPATSPVPIEINNSLTNNLGLTINKDLELGETILISGVEFKKDDIFVFPYLSSKKYRNIDFNEKSLKNILDFKYKQEKNNLICISGEENSGKTLLAEFIFKYYFNNNYFPLFCNGDEIESVKDENKFIKSCITKNYENSNANYEKFITKISKTKKILIVDDFTHGDLNKLESIASYFQTVIVFSNSRFENIFESERSFLGKQILRLEIEPLYSSKRKELIKKVLTILNDRSTYKKNIEPYIDKIDRLLEGHNFEICNNPISIIYLIVSIYENSFETDNDFYSLVYRAKVILNIDKELSKKKLSSSIKVILRMASKIAFDLYVNKESFFVRKEIDDVYNWENKFYGKTPFSSDYFCELLERCKIFNTKNGKYSFFSKDVFSFFVATFIFNNKNKFSKKMSIRKIINSAMKSSLEFNILMCLATYYSDDYCYKKIIKKLESFNLHEKKFCDNSLKKLGLATDDFDKLKKLDQKQIEKIDENNSEKEQKKREKYLKNKDNLYYDEKLDKKTKEIVCWLNRLSISCCILKRFNTDLDIDDKNKLIDIVLKIPNIILYKVDKYIFSELDRLYVQTIKEFKNDVSQSTFDQLNECVIDLKRSLILSVYDISSRSFSSCAIIDLLKEKLEKDNALVNVQKLMLMSFSTGKETTFIEECTKIIKNGGKRNKAFLVTSAKLIGRQFVFRNYEFCTTKQRQFLSLIFENMNDVAKIGLCKNVK